MRLWNAAWVVLVAQLAGCGRLGFDATAAAAPDATIDGALPPDGLPPDSSLVTTFGVGPFVYVVPNGCPTIRVKAWGGGGGGGGDNGVTTVTSGQSGGTTSFGMMSATGGGGGDHGNLSPMSTFIGGIGGAASGGDLVIGGQAGGAGNPATTLGTSGHGGDAPMGGIGGQGVSMTNTNGKPGGFPGAGGSGGQGASNPAAGGGSGAFAERVIAVAAGESFMGMVGEGGAGGSGTLLGGDGAEGAVLVGCE